MKPEEFQEIEEYLEEFSYTSMCYTEYEEVKHYEVICRTKKVIVISGYHQEAKCQECHWAANTPDDLLEVIKGKHFLVTFVPREWVTDLKKAGFQVRNAWHDYFMGNFADVPEYSQSMEILKKEECREASELTLSCCGQSRGFTGQTPEWMEEWVSQNKGVADNRIIVVQRNEAGELVGLVCTGIYGEEETGGVTSWIREVAVRRDYQNRGIARALIMQALGYGKEHGAVQAFLAVDEENANAIHLYESIGFVASEEESQIDMIE